MTYVKNIGHVGSKKNIHNAGYMILIFLLLVFCSVLRGINPKKAFQLHFIDTVGQCILIDIEDKEILIDGGSSPKILREYLDYTRVIKPPLELLIVTNSDLEHCFGLQAIFGVVELVESKDVPKYPPIKVSEVWMPGEYPSVEEIINKQIVILNYHGFVEDFFFRLLQLIQKNPDIKIKRPLEDFHPPALKTGHLDWFTLPSVPLIQFGLLNSGARIPKYEGSWSRGKLSRLRDNASIVLLIKIGEKKIMIGSDAGGVQPFDQPIGVEEALLNLESKNRGILNADLLIAPREGRSSAGSSQYIRAIDPDIVLFGPPTWRRGASWLRPTEVKRYKKEGRVILQPDLHNEGGIDHIICQFTEKGELSCKFGMGFGEGKRQWIGKDKRGDIITIDNANRSIRIGRVTRPFSRNSHEDFWAGAILSRLNLEEIGRKDFSSLDMSKTDLQFAHLEQGTFTGVDFTQAKLNNAHLGKANMKNATLIKANLSNSYLAGADLTGANLSGAILRDADLSGVCLRNTILDRANLDGAVLKGAQFFDSSLKGASIKDANFEGVIFEPLDWSVKSLRTLRNSPYLSTLTYKTSPHALIELRADLRQAGFQEVARNLTFTIEKIRTDRAFAIEKWFRRLMFEWTVSYGRDPARPLLVVLILIVLFAVPYGFAMRGKYTSAIFRVPVQDPVGIPGEIVKAERVEKRGLNVLGFGLYFSLVSAFHIGWRELNIGSWILRMQPRTYGLRSTGWVRVLSGVQSVTSIYLFALALLSYFGQPFG